MHYAAWLARRWEDPAFSIAFPWFNTQRYWDEHVLALREQVALMEEWPLEWKGNDRERGRRQGGLDGERREAPAGIAIVTHCVEHLDVAESAWSGVPGYRTVERGELPAELCAAWDTPAAEGQRYCLMQPASGEEVLSALRRDRRARPRPARHPRLERHGAARHGHRRARDAS